MIRRLSKEELRKRCDPASIASGGSKQAGRLETIIGQERAIRSLQFGLGIRELGFNIYVAGVPGTGRTTAVRSFLEREAIGRAIPSDLCYVNSFTDPYRPNGMRLPPGRARELQSDMKELIEAVVRAIRGTFESEEYATHRQTAVQELQSQRDELLKQVTSSAQQQGFLVQATPMGLLTVPVRDGRPLDDEGFMALPPDERSALLEKREKVQAEIETAVRQVKRLDKSAQAGLHQLDQQVAEYATSHLISDLKEKYRDVDEVGDYLDDVQRDVLRNLDQFRAERDEEGQSALRSLESQEFSLSRYGVNVLVDNSGLKGAPVVIELNPTYKNLFGRIEQEAQFGVLRTDFTLIREGALHRANGGYLVLPARELLGSPFAWESLKRALANRQILVEDATEQSGLFATKSLRPEPVSLDIKVVLIGTADLYQLLRAYDEHFDELFKVKADFDMRMPRTDENIQNYAAFTGTVCENENLRHLDPSGIARLVEHGSRLVGDQEALSTHFGEIADILREAGYYAAQDDASLVSADHIGRAIDQRFYRSSLIQERLQELIERGTVMIDLSGRKVGQVNGLSVIGMGDISFGRPSRITATYALGREGLVDIEREANLGGPIHTKGVLILAGYLSDRFAQERPLSLSARIVFEQSYSGVEGDSASSTELYALLSALSGLPIRQGVAVTGSVNQKGEVQAIGGVNEKVEGFFAICKAKGLTGDQGVMIPSSNVANLMLKNEVLEAAEAGQFHVWSVETIEEGIEVLTGVKAGRRLEDGTYEEGTVLGSVDKRLGILAERMIEFGGIIRS